MGGLVNSQGEPLAALSRMADGTFRQISLRPDDIVIFSSSPIPGNAVSISRTINKLYLKGIKVFTNTSLSELHTSGHANLGVECGIPKENTFVVENGDILILKNHVITKSKEKVSGEDIYVDGNRIGEVGSVVLRDRKIMANDGILVVIANIDMEKRNLLIKPNITTRGFILVNENEQLIKEIETTAYSIIKDKLDNTKDGINDIKSKLITDLIPFIENKTGRRPIILPVIIDIKK